jgi:hypothetical protein
VNALERVTRVLERARFDGGWIDEDVARRVLLELGLTDDGERAISPSTSSELGHG